MCTHWLDLSGGVSSAPNRDRMQKLRSQEVDVSTIPIGAHKPFGFSSFGVRVLGFTYVKKALSLILIIIFLRMQVTFTSLLKDKLSPFQQVFHFVFLQSLYISFINRNHVLVYFYVSDNFYLYFIAISLLSFRSKNNLDHNYKLVTCLK